MRLEHLLILLGGLIAGLAGGQWVHGRLLEPAKVRAVELRLEADELAKRVAAAREAARLAAEQRADEESARASLADSAHGFAPPDNPLPWVNQLIARASAGKDVKVERTTLRRVAGDPWLSPPWSAADYGPFSVRLEGSAPLPQALDFIRAMEEAHPWGRLIALSMTPDRESPDRMRLDMGVEWLATKR
jgi:hypothetical protein